MSTITITRTDTDLVTEECYRCGVLFAFPNSLKESALRHSQAAPGDTISFWCPNGHKQSYTGKNEEQRLRDRLAEANARAAREQARAEHKERQRAAQKAATTRAKKRHAAGVCPCCGRSFKQLREHMKTQHPDYDPSA